MAKIPVGEAGYRVAQAPRGPSIGSMPSVGDGVAALGRAGMAVAGQMQDDERAEDRQRAGEARADATAERAQRDQEMREIVAARRQRAQIEAGTRVLTFEADVEDALARNRERLFSGDLDQVGFIGELNSAVDKARSAATKDADPETVPLIEQAMTRSSRKIERDSRSTLIEGEKRTTLASLTTATEVLERSGVADPATAVSRAEALYQGAAGLIGPDVAAKGVAAFKERVWRSHFLRAVDAVKDDPAGLKAVRERVSKADALDPVQQTALIASIDSRQALLENRAQAAADRRDRQAGQAFQALQALDANGLPLSPEFVTEQLGKLRGTPLEQAALAIVQGSVDTARFGALPLEQQDRILMAEYAKAGQEGVDPARSARLGKLRGIAEASRTAYRDDPWKAAVERGVIQPPAPIDLSSPDALSRSLAARMEQAQAVDRQAGRAVTPLRPEEAMQLGDMLQRLPVAERVRFLSGISKTIGGRRLEDLSRQLGAKDGSLAIAASMEAQGMRTVSGRSVAELYLHGVQAMRDKTVDDGRIRARTGVSEAETRAQMAAIIGDAYTSPEATRAAIDTAYAVYAAQVVEGKSPSVDGVVDLVTGGFMDMNGRKVPLPYGWTEDQTRRALRAVTAQDIESAAGGGEVRVGGNVMSAADLAKQLPSTVLRSAGPNRYAVQIGNQIVTRADGRTFYLSIPRR